MQAAETSLQLHKQEDYFFSENQTGMDVGALLRKVDPVRARPSGGQPSPSCLFSPSEAWGQSRRKPVSLDQLNRVCGLWSPALFYYSYTFCGSYLSIILLSRVDVTVLSHQMKPQEENTYAGLS